MYVVEKKKSLHMIHFKYGKARVHTTHTHHSIVGFLVQILAGGFNHTLHPHSTVPATQYL